MKAVIIPTGRTMGDKIDLARVSEARRIRAPRRAEVGIKNRWS